MINKARQRTVSSCDPPRRQETPRSADQGSPLESASTRCVTPRPSNPTDRDDATLRRSTHPHVDIFSSGVSPPSRHARCHPGAQRLRQFTVADVTPQHGGQGDSGDISLSDFDFKGGVVAVGSRYRTRMTACGRGRVWLACGKQRSVPLFQHLLLWRISPRPRTGEL